MDTIKNNFDASGSRTAEFHISDPDQPLEDRLFHIDITQIRHSDGADFPGDNAMPAFDSRILNTIAPGKMPNKNDKTCEKKRYFNDGKIEIQINFSGCAEGINLW